MHRACIPPGRGGEARSLSHRSLQIPQPQSVMVGRVMQGDERTAALYPMRALFLCYPPPGYATRAP